MISLNDFNQEYIKLYTAMRNYIWDINTVECLADLEIATYDRFPDIDEVINLFRRLKSNVVNSQVYSEDEELQNSFNEFEELLGNTEIIYSPLPSLTITYDETEQPLIKLDKEEINHGDKDNEEPEEGFREETRERNNKADKKLFNIEHIRKSTTDSR